MTCSVDCQCSQFNASSKIRWQTVSSREVYLVMAAPFFLVDPVVISWWFGKTQWRCVSVLLRKQRLFDCKGQRETTLIVELKSESLLCFQEERGVAGQLLLNKPWPLSIRPEELIRHETGQTQVRNEGHWVTKQTAFIHEGQHLIQPTGFWGPAHRHKFTLADCNGCSSQAEIILKPEHLPKANPFRQRTPSDYHSVVPTDPLALNRLTSSTKTGVHDFMASLTFSCVFVVPPHRKPSNHHHFSHSPSFKFQTITLTELWIISCHLRCSLSWVNTKIKDHRLWKEMFIYHKPSVWWRKLCG